MNTKKQKEPEQLYRLLKTGEEITPGAGIFIENCVFVPSALTGQNFNTEKCIPHFIPVPSPSSGLLPGSVTREWVRCPVCGERDTRKEMDKEGNALILCVNHGCASNGGNNSSAIRQPSPSPASLAKALKKLVAAEQHRRRDSINSIMVRQECDEALEFAVEALRARTGQDGEVHPNNLKAGDWHMWQRDPIEDWQGPKQSDGNLPHKYHYKRCPAPPAAETGAEKDGRG